MVNSDSGDQVAVGDNPLVANGENADDNKGDASVKKECFETVFLQLSL